MIPARTHDLFPGLTPTRRLEVLQDVLECPVPFPVEQYLDSLEDGDPYPLVQFYLATTPDSVLGATVAMRTAVQDDQAFALTQGPPWVGYLPSLDHTLQSVSEDGSMEPLNLQFSDGAMLRQQLLAELDLARFAPKAAEAPDPGEAAKQDIDQMIEKQLARPLPKAVGELLIDADVATELMGPDAETLRAVAVVDERSVAAVIREEGGLTSHPAGSVVRWFLEEVADAHQGALLDTKLSEYIDSLVSELKARKVGLRRVLDEIGPAFEESHIKRSKRPRDYVVRPVRIACQNVIVGLAAFAQDSSFDGLSVVAWQTCEVPHVATHEGNRALAALTLCDAFRNGGTMEIRFDRGGQINLGGKRKRYEGHPEKGHVPASLRRFGRTLDVELGAEHPAAISPREARELFQAVTPMPEDLTRRFTEAVKRDGIAPERLCFTLLSQLWREIELDVILALTSRAASILEGGTDWPDRGARQAESEVCRAATMIGMLYRRLDAVDAAAADVEIRPVEDRNQGVTWTVDPSNASVTLKGISPGVDLPWARGAGAIAGEELVVLPRSYATRQTLEQAGEVEGPVAVVLPCDAPEPPPTGHVLVLRCPDRLSDLDRAIEEKLLTSRTSR